MESAATTGLPNVYLKPGELYIARTPALVYTVLGSCVAVTMHSAKRSIGAICHAMLPEGCSCCNGGRCGCAGKKARKNELKYVDCAIEHMIEGLAELGAGSDELEVRVLGGSTMVANRHDLKIGRLNSKKAYELLGAKGFDIAEYAVGGTLGRKVYYNTQTGEVFWNWIRRRPEHARLAGTLTRLGNIKRHIGGNDE